MERVTSSLSQSDITGALNGTSWRLGLVVRETLLAAARSSSELDSSANNLSQSNHMRLEQMLGPRRRELYMVILVTIVYVIIFITGIVGNVCTCIVIARNRYMQTATNYYLFNLSVADLLVLVLGLPFEAYTFWSAYPWVFGGTFCILRALASEAATYASILTITAFTVERYIAICHPMRAQTMSSLSRAIKVIVLIWLIGSVCTIPVVIQFGIVYIKDSNNVSIAESALCSVQENKRLEHSFEISTFLFFLTPMTVITVLYVLIGLTVKRSTLSRNGSVSSASDDPKGRSNIRAQQQARARRAVLKMLVAVVVAFFVCWAPFHVQRLLVIYGGNIQSPALYITHKVLFYTSGIFYYISSTINPILYNIMSLKFRQAFKRTIFRLCTNPNKSQTLATFKFYTKPLSESQVSMTPGQNGARCHWRRLRNGIQCNLAFRQAIALEPRASSSSTSANSAVRMLKDERLQELELEPAIKPGSKSRSFQGIPIDQADYHPRLYHSFA